MNRVNREIAIKNDQASAAQQASMGIAKLHGLLVDRSEVKTTADMTLEQVQDRIKEIEAELAALEHEARAPRPIVRVGLGLKLGGKRKTERPRPLRGE